MLCKTRPSIISYTGLTVTFAFWLCLSADPEMAVCPSWTGEFMKEILADLLRDEWLTAVLRAEKVRLRVISSVSILITWHFIAVIKQTFILFAIDLQTKQMGWPRHKLWAFRASMSSALSLLGLTQAGKKHSPITAPLMFLGTTGKGFREVLLCIWEPFQAPLLELCLSHTDWLWMPRRQPEKAITKDLSVAGASAHLFILFLFTQFLCNSYFREG